MSFQLDTSQSSFSFNGGRVIALSQRVSNRTLFQIGGYGSRIAKNSMRKARKIRVSELPDDAQEEYREQLEDYRNGYRKRPPVLGDIISDPGNPPLLHQSPSPLKVKLRFNVDKAEGVVVWGPEVTLDRAAGDLEYGLGKVKQARPYIGPSFKKTLPRIPQLLRNSATRG